MEIRNFPGAYVTSPEENTRIEAETGRWQTHRHRAYAPESQTDRIAAFFFLPVMLCPVLGVIALLPPMRNVSLAAGYFTMAVGSLAIALSPLAFSAAEPETKNHVERAVIEVSDRLVIRKVEKISWQTPFGRRQKTKERTKVILDVDLSEVASLSMEDCIVFSLKDGSRRYLCVRDGNQDRLFTLFRDIADALEKKCDSQLPRPTAKALEVGACKSSN